MRASTTEVVAGRIDSTNLSSERACASGLCLASASESSRLAAGEAACAAAKWFPLECEPERADFSCATFHSAVMLTS